MSAKPDEEASAGVVALDRVFPGESYSQITEALIPMIDTL